MGHTKIGSALRKRDVFRLAGPSSKKVVVTSIEKYGPTVGISYLPVIDKGKLLSSNEGRTSIPSERELVLLGSWDGDLTRGASGILNTTASNGAEGEGRMATKTASKKSGSKKGTSKASSNSGERKRASNEELDALAAKVVDLRDNKGKSWGEIEEALDVNPGRLRSLYNRGGGVPTRERKGSAKAAPKKSSGSSRRGSKRGKKADPSEED